MSGFFQKEELTTKPRQRTIEGCGGCGLYKDCKNPKMKPEGQGERGILIVSDAPTDKADKEGRWLAGSMSQTLRKALRKRRVDLDIDCVTMGAVCCACPEPSAAQIEYCRPLLWNQIKEMKPRLIILLGMAAVESFISHRWTKSLDGIDKWRGWVIPDRDAGCFVVPVFHPEYLSKNSSSKKPNKAIDIIWNNDINAALDTLDRSFPKLKEESSCIEILEGKGLYERLRKLNKSELSEIAFDLETSGLKPHRKGHFIDSCAIAESHDYAFSFEIPDDEKILKLLRATLHNPAVRKVAQNLKFEHNWIQEILGVEVRGWVHDTMLTAHMIDNRKYITGLKFQSYVQFGLLPYDEHISSFLCGVEEKDGNSLNRVREIPVKDKLIYNGIDALVTLRLKYLQTGGVF